MRNAAIIGTEYATIPIPSISRPIVKIRPPGLADMSMTSVKPTVVRVITVMYMASIRPYSPPPMTQNPTAPMPVTATRLANAMPSRFLSRWNSLNSAGRVCGNSCLLFARGRAVSTMHLPSKNASSLHLSGSTGDICQPVLPVWMLAWRQVFLCGGIV